MSVMERYIQQLGGLHDQLQEAEQRYQAALLRVTAVQQADGDGQLMYVPVGGSPIQLDVPPEAYKSMLQDMTKAGVNSAVARLADLWELVEALAIEVDGYIANAQSRSGVVVKAQSQEPPHAATQAATADTMPQFTDTASAVPTAVTNALNDTGPVPPYPSQAATTVPLPPRVRRIPAGG